MQTAKVFKSGNSMAIRIPKDLMIGNIKEFVIKKVGQKIILTPKSRANQIDDLFDTLKKIGGVDLQREDLPLQEREF